MSGSHSEETKEISQELCVGTLLDEEFRSVFGGTIPVTTPWVGLNFT
jgi:hypothetical protein